MRFYAGFMRFWSYSCRYIFISTKSVTFFLSFGMDIWTEYTIIWISDLRVNVCLSWGRRCMFSLKTPRIRRDLVERNSQHILKLYNSNSNQCCDLLSTATKVKNRWFWAMRCPRTSHMTSGAKSDKILIDVVVILTQRWCPKWSRSIAFN